MVNEVTHNVYGAPASTGRVAAASRSQEVVPPNEVVAVKGVNVQLLTPQQQTATEKTESVPLDEVVAEMNSYVKPMNRQLQFSVHDESGETVISVIDVETDEVLRQIPSEEALQLHERMREYSGLIFNEKV
jgi:flagellar protein FlaG